MYQNASFTEFACELSVSLCRSPLLMSAGRFSFLPPAAAGTPTSRHAALLRSEPGSLHPSRWDTWSLFRLWESEEKRGN